MACKGERSEIIVRILLWYEAICYRHVGLLFRLQILLVESCKFVVEIILWPGSSIVQIWYRLEVVSLLENCLVGSKNLTLDLAATNPRLLEILLRGLRLSSAWLEFNGFKIIFRFLGWFYVF